MQPQYLSLWKSVQGSSELWKTWRGVKAAVSYILYMSQSAKQLCPKCLRFAPNPDLFVRYLLYTYCSTIYIKPVSTQTYDWVIWGNILIFIYFRLQYGIGGGASLDCKRARMGFFFRICSYNIKLFVLKYDQNIWARKILNFKMHNVWEPCLQTHLKNRKMAQNRQNKWTDSVTRHVEWIDRHLNFHNFRP